MLDQGIKITIMKKKQTSTQPREMPLPLKKPEIKENDFPETTVPPDEEPITIPQEAPSTPSPVEMPPIPEKQNILQ
jgi:hypothetical protein